MSEQEKIHIRPGVKILSVLSHLNYKPWFAIAEFVDNSIQSFLDYGKEIRQWDGDKTRLKVEIEIDSGEEGYVVVRDNAAVSTKRTILMRSVPQAYHLTQADCPNSGWE